MVSNGMNRLATQGIILRRTDYGEADRIITFITPDYGKIRAIAKGVRKSKSKMAGGIELFSVSELHLIKGKGDIDTLTSTRLIKHFGRVVQDLDRTKLAYEFLKSINKTVEDNAGGDYFHILLDSLAALDEPRISLAITEVSFDMRILQILGHVPDFAVDKNGNSLKESDNFSFDFDSISFISNEQGLFNKNHLKILKLFAYNTPQSVAAVQGIGSLTSDVLPLVRSMSQQYIPN